MKKILDTIKQKWADYILEIIVIVIGILGAFALNNWNEQQKKNQEEKYYLRQLRDEFTGDSIRLQRYIRLTDIKANRGKELRGLLGSKSESLDTLLTDIFFNGRVLQFDSNTPTFDEITSSGKSNVLSGERLKFLIKSYRNELNRMQIFLYQENQRKKESYNSHVAKYFEPEIDTYLRRNWPQISKDEIQKFAYDIENFKKDPLTTYHINVQIGVDALLNLMFEETLMPQIQEILKELRNELSNQSLAMD